ncbi:hypothetical protein D5S18_07750 [Nocardia panacis]|uniref:Uncharacterized protein n=2 Tax=Nocardia panacis TaxID=2340916 RepID=A0A3A4K0N8_9NOCA|nr:hypothetical protein D5S18_07750 [Nocardia panacis]
MALLAIPAFLVQVRTYGQDGWLEVRPGARKRQRRIKRLKEVVESLDTDDPPQQIEQELAAAKRDLESLFVVTTDANEQRVTDRSAVMFMSLMAMVYLVWLLPISIGVGIPFYVAALIWIGPYINARQRRQARCLLYVRLGARSDVPAIPELSCWPFVSRGISAFRMTRWLNMCLGNGEPCAPQDITAEEIAALRTKIEQWCANPWWRRAESHWESLSAALSRVAQRRPSTDP